jgi:hypothetical protein
LEVYDCIVWKKEELSSPVSKIEREKRRAWGYRSAPFTGAI